MNILKITNMMNFITVLLFVFTSSYYQTAFSTEHETGCKQHIQGKIAWDPTSNYESASKWDDKNLDYLCQGTKAPKAPGDCFHAVMTGHVSHGDSDKWEYKNAIELCSGTSNADETVSCFKGKIADKINWNTAISQCQAKKKLENVAE